MMERALRLLRGSCITITCIIINKQCSKLFHVSFSRCHSTHTTTKQMLHSYAGVVLMALWLKLILLHLVKFYSWWSYIQLKVTLFEPAVQWPCAVSLGVIIPVSNHDLVLCEHPCSDTSSILLQLAQTHFVYNKQGKLTISGGSFSVVYMPICVCCF